MSAPVSESGSVRSDQSNQIDTGIKANDTNWHCLQFSVPSCVTCSGSKSESAHTFIRLSAPMEEQNIASRRAVPEVCFVIDRSGSMAGSPIRSVNTILLDLLEVSESSAQVATPTIIEYNTIANQRLLSSCREQPIVANGGTMFSCAYGAMTTFLTQYGIRHRDRVRSPASRSASRRMDEKNVVSGGGGGVTFIFMSDGEADVSDRLAMETATVAFKNMVNQLNDEFIGVGGVSVTVHVIGLGSSVHEALLTSVSKFGNVSGSFRYSVGSDDLGEKFRDLFTYGLTEMPCSIIIGDHVDPITGKMRSEFVIKTNVRMVEDEERSDEEEDKRSKREVADAILAAKRKAQVVAASASSRFDSSSEATAIDVSSSPLKSTPIKNTLNSYIIEALLPLDCAAAPLPIGTKITLNIVGSEHPVFIPVLPPVTPPSPQLLLSAYELFDPLTTGEVAELMKRVVAIPTRSRRMMERVALENQRGVLLERLTKMMQLLNASAISSNGSGSGGVDSAASIRALRLNDLRSEHKFSRNRRTRMMAIREADAIKEMQSLQANLEVTWKGTSESLIKLNELSKISQTGDWRCMLSLESLEEMMRGSLDDCLCIGLLVTRDESVVDSPQTGLRLLSVASSLVSFNSFVEVMSRAKAEKGFQAATGGFKHKKRGVGNDINGANHIAGARSSQDQDDSDDDVAYAFVGQGREKINAVFPLALCTAHLKRVLLLKSMWLSYLFTLDSLGYDKQQEVGAFALLAQAVSSFDSTERQAIILREMLQVCGAIMSQSSRFALAFPEDRFHNFIHTIDGLQRQYVPNLLTPAMIGWIGHRFNGKQLKHENEHQLTTHDSSNNCKSESVSKDAISSSSIDFRLNLPLLRAIYLAYTQRMVRDAYSSLQVESMKIVSCLLYGDTTSKSKNDNSSSETAAIGTSPYEVQLNTALAEFAGYFYDPSLPVPSLPPPPTVSGTSSNAPTRTICPIDQVASLVEELMPTLPPFLERLLQAIDQLEFKWSQLGLMNQMKEVVNEETKVVEDEDAAASSYMTLARSLIPSTSMVQSATAGHSHDENRESLNHSHERTRSSSHSPSSPRRGRTLTSSSSTGFIPTRAQRLRTTHIQLKGEQQKRSTSVKKTVAAERNENELELYRRHLVVCYYHHNEAPPSGTTHDGILSTAHARLELRAKEKFAAGSLAEANNALAGLIVDVDDLAAFGGLLRFYCPTRNGPLFRLVCARLIHRSDREKLSCLLRNRIHDQPLYLRPALEQQVWIPIGYDLCTSIKSIVGRQRMDEISEEHRRLGRTRGHLYRESDKPNGCGHCNSIPWQGHFRPFINYD